MALVLLPRGSSSIYRRQAPPPVVGEVSDRAAWRHVLWITARFDVPRVSCADAGPTTQASSMWESPLSTQHTNGAPPSGKPERGRLLHSEANNANRVGANGGLLDGQPAFQEQLVQQVPAVVFIVEGGTVGGDETIDLLEHLLLHGTCLDHFIPAVLVVVED